MKKGPEKSKIAITALILIFSLFVLSDAYPLKTHYQEDMFKQLIKEGEDLYKKGAMERAVVVFTMALTYAQTNQEYQQAYWNLSLAHFYNSQLEETLEILRKLFEIQPDITIDESLYDPRFVEMFNTVKNEGLEQQIKEEEKEPAKYEIQKEPAVQTVPLKKQRLKKRRRFPLLPIIGAVVAVGAVAVYLALPKTGEIEIKSFPPGADIFLDNDNIGQKTNSTISDLKPGEYSVKLLKDGYGDYEKEIEVQAGKTATVTAHLNPHSISVTQPNSGTDWTQGDTVTIKWNTGGGLSQGSFITTFQTQTPTPNSLSPNRIGTTQKSKISNRLNDREGISRSTSSSSFSRTAEPSRFLQDRSIKNRALVDNRIRTPSTNALENKNNSSFYSQMFDTNTEVKLQTLSQIKIDLLRNNQHEQQIVASAPNSGSFQWTIPSTLPDSSQYKVKIFCSTDDNVYGESSEFSISADVGQIQVNSTPTGANIWLNGQNTGYTTNHLFENVSTGSHPIKLVKARYQDWEGSVTVTKNITSTINITLEVGAFTEDFNDGVADHFIESHPALWWVSSVDNVYRFKGDGTFQRTTSHYNLGNFADFDLEVRVKSFDSRWGLAFRGNSDFSDYYYVYINPNPPNGQWGVWKMDSGVSSTVKNYATSSLIKTDMTWNWLKIEARGQDFHIYINGSYVDTVSIGGVPSTGKIGLASYSMYTNVLDFDDVILTLPAAPAIQTNKANILYPKPGQDPDEKK